MLDKDWCRSLVNQRIGRIKRIFKWAVSEELAPAAVFQALATVTGLQQGRTQARESNPVLPVDAETIDATLVELNRQVAGMIELQRLTGMRPGEVCLIRRCDIDMSGAVWLFKPHHHKLAYKNKLRIIAIGPKAQELLRGFFVADINAYLFSPQLATDEHLAKRSANRMTPRYPSHLKRNIEKRTGNTELAPKDRYDVTSYNRAIARAVKRVNRERTRLAVEKGTTPMLLSHWHSNQLRHTFATTVRKQHGLEAAQVLLGHSRADVTQIYAERNEALAVAVASVVG